MARGDQPSILREKETPPEGIAGPGKVLMVHPGKGYRWIPAELKEKKLRGGYGFVREYCEGDELGSSVQIADLSPEQLKAKAEAMLKMAGNKAEKKELTEKEREYIENKAAKERKAAEDQARAEGRGLKR